MKFTPKLIFVTMFVSLLILLAWQAQPDLAHTSDGSPSHAWSYVCDHGQCFRNETLRHRSPTDPVEASIAVCRLACGQYGTLWPRPQQASLSDSLVETHPSMFEFSVDGVAGGEEAKSFLREAGHLLMTDWTKELGAVAPPAHVNTRVLVKFSTLSPDMSLTWRTVEIYSMVMNLEDNNKLVVEINSTTVYGARHGLETLGQLGEVFEGRLLMVGGASVVDYPSFAHRGVLIDTSRHFLPVEAIIRTLDAMAASKLNVLHWHATDSHSFPVFFPSVPEMSRYGAYSEKEVYTPEDIKRLIKYAKQRGIRILFELDTPSHSGNGWQWGESQGLGNLAVCVNQAPWRSYCVQPPCGQLNPVNPHVYTILAKIYKEIQNLFSADDMFHMGGDEVYFPCWNSSKEITDWMKAKGIGKRTNENFLKLWGRFQKSALEAWDTEAGHSDTPIILWSSHLTEPEVIEKYLDPKRYIIETWVESSERLPDILLSKGYKLILATKDAWYLDHGFDDRTRFYSWKTVYDNKIPSKAGVLGGEGTLWGELVDDFSLDNRLWPRAAALAERLWTDPTSPPQSAEPRLLQHRERLVKKGIRPSTITPEWCFQNDGHC